MGVSSVVAGPGGGRLLSGQSGTSFAAGGGAGSMVPPGTETDPASRFVDWPTCIVFGVKRDVSERRYVAWDPDPSDMGSANACVKFAIMLDFPARTITYLADRGERRWSVALAHEGRVYPVIASSTAHYFQIQYGVHI